ncbi:hypothetical protein BH23GEM9_BH23GEM9_22060 [soil metagenome]
MLMAHGTGHGLRPLYAYAVFAALSGCGGDGAPTADEQRAACIEFAESGLAFDGGTRAQVIEAWGQPDLMHTIVQAAAFESAPGLVAEDSIFRMHYSGAVVSLHKPAGGAELIDEVRVQYDHYLRLPEPIIGMKANDVMALYGEPAQRTADQLVYICHSVPARDDPVAFNVVDGEVREVVFTYHMD